MKCTNCSHENRPGVKFCEQCGTQMPKDQPVETTGKFCSNCGQAINFGSRFCEHCGNPVNQVDSQSIVNRKPTSGKKTIGILIAFGGMIVILAIIFVIVLGINTNLFTNGLINVFNRNSRNFSTETIYPVQLNTDKTINSPAIIPDSSGFGRNNFPEKTLIYEQEYTDVGELLIFETDGFRYIKWNGMWAAIEAGSNNPDTFFILGTNVGTWQWSDNSYTFIPNGYESVWTQQILSNAPGIQQVGEYWVMGNDQSIADWLVENKIDDGIWIQDGSDILLIKTSGDNDLPSSWQTGKVSKPFLNPYQYKFSIWHPIQIFAGLTGGPSAVLSVAIIEKIIKWDFADGCGDATRSLLVPDSDFVTLIFTQGMIDNFDEACAAHDKCYEQYDTTRLECDNAMYEKLKDSCEYIPFCEATADLYYSQVRGAGESFYNYKHASMDLNARLFAEEEEIAQGKCTTVMWEVNSLGDNGSDKFYETRFDGQKVDGKGKQKICPNESRSYGLTVKSKFQEISLDLDITVLKPISGSISVTADECNEQVKGYIVDYSKLDESTMEFTWSKSTAFGNPNYHMIAYTDSGNAQYECNYANATKLSCVGRIPAVGVGQNFKIELFDSEKECSIFSTNTSLSSEFSQNRCQLFEDIKITVTYLDWTSGAPLQFHFKMPGGVPGIGKKITGDSKPWEYSAKIGSYTSSNCATIQGYDDRLYCTVSLPSGYSNTMRPLSLNVNGCESPIYAVETAFLPQIEAGGGGSTAGGGNDSGGETSGGGGSSSDPGVEIGGPAGSCSSSLDPTSCSVYGGTYITPFCTTSPCPSPFCACP